MRFIFILMILNLCACSTQGHHDRISQPELPGLGLKHGSQMTYQECIQANGVVVGDIGNGQIHHPDYLCNNGEVPLGTIVPAMDEAVPTEGSVCCRP